MSARHKLNSAAFTGAAVVAGRVGGLAGSWDVFLVTVAILLLAAALARDIRLGGGRHR